MCELPGRFPRAWGQPTVPTAKPALWDAYRNRSRRRYRLAWVLLWVLWERKKGGRGSGYFRTVARSPKAHDGGGQFPLLSARMPSLVWRWCWQSGCAVDLQAPLHGQVVPDVPLESCLDSRVCKQSVAVRGRWWQRDVRVVVVLLVECGRGRRG